MRKIGFIFLILSSVTFVSEASDLTKNAKNKFFSTIEDFLEGNFEDTDFSIKSKDGLK